MTSKYLKCDTCGQTLGMEQVFTAQSDVVHWGRTGDFLRAAMELGWAEYRVPPERAWDDGMRHKCPECVVKGAA